MAHFSIITPTCSRGFNHKFGWLWMNFMSVLCPKCTNSLQLRPLLLVLLAMLSASSPAHGKVIKPGLKPENLFKQASAGCLTQKDSKFPQTVRVNLSISNTNQDTRASLDVSSRSLAPWDYRYDPCPMTWKDTGCPGQENCFHLYFQCFRVERFWKYEGVLVPIILFEREPVQKAA